MARFSKPRVSLRYVKCCRDAGIKLCKRTQGGVKESPSKLNGHRPQVFHAEAFLPGALALPRRHRCPLLGEPRLPGNGPTLSPSHVLIAHKTHGRHVDKLCQDTISTQL